MSELQISYRPVNELVPYANNARTHSEEQVQQIADSIKAFGWTNPVIVDGKNGIIAGHGRVLAAKIMKMPTVPCLEVKHLSEQQKQAYILADNKLSLNAGWDNGLLRVELGELKDAGFDLDLTGFSLDEIDALLGPDGNDGLTDPDAAPDAGTQAATQPGDIWLLGKHRVMCGDAARLDHLESLTQGNLVDMWLTDPPYNVAIQGGNHGDPNRTNGLRITNDAMTDEEFRQFLVDAFTSADTVMKKGAVFYIWHADVETYNFYGAAKDTSWTVRQCLIWKKSSIVMGRKDYHSKHEPCIYGWKDGAAHLWAADRKQTTILEFDKPSRNKEHPTMKPVALFEYLMLNNTKGDDIVLDSFGGSGTTLIAAEKNGRKAYLMELDPIYCDVIIKRWQAFTGQQALLEETGKPFDQVIHGRE